MKGLISFYSVFFKARLLSRSFAAISAIILILAVGFSMLCPDPSPTSAVVGLLYDSSDLMLSENMQHLLVLEEVRFIRYSEEDEMLRDIISGKLHCGYRIETDTETPITVYETDASFLTPALDELVFSSWFETIMLQKAPSLYGNGSHAALINDTIAHSRLQNKPFTVDIKVNTANSGGVYQSYSLLPIVYAVIIPLLLLGSCFCALLAPIGERDTLMLLCKSDKIHLRSLASRFLAHASLFMLLYFGCDAILNTFIVQNSFSALARLLCAVIISAAAAALFELFYKIKANSAVIFLITVLSVLSVIFSGAFISPELLGGLEPLKYLSPSWLLLRFMTAVSAL